MKFAVTLKDLREKRACFYGYNRLVRALQGNDFSEKDMDRESYIRCRHTGLIPVEYILSSNGLDDALWSLRCVKDADRDLRLFAVWCVRQVQHLINDERSINALDVAERFANGQASESERAAAWDAAAWDAAAGDAAWDAARDAAGAAARDAAGDAARAAAGDAAWDAAGAAAGAAARAAAWDAAARAAARDAAGDAARDAARDAAWDAAWDAAGAAQSEMLIKMCRGKAPWQVGVSNELQRPLEG